MLHPPKPASKPTKLQIQGHERIDNYFWMNKRDDPAVLEHLRAENEYRKAMMAPVEDLQETIYQEIVSRVKEDDESVPYFDNDYWYYTRLEKGREYPIFCRKYQSLESAEEVILDVNELAENKTYCEVADFSISPDNKWMAFAADYEGRRKYTIQFKNLETGEVIDHTIANTAGELEWAADSATLFYISINEETLRNDKLYAVKRDRKNSEILKWHEENEAFDLTLDISKSKKYLLITSESKTASEIKYMEAKHPGGALQVFHPRTDNHLYSVDHLDGTFYILSNYQALNFQLFNASDQDPSFENWQVVIPHRKQVLIEDVELFDDFMVTEERKNGLVSLVVRTADGSEDHTISFEETAYMATIHTNPNGDTPWLRYQFSSLTTPKTIVDYNMATRERKVQKVQEIPGGYDSDEYVSERLWAPSHDMVEVPISLVRKKDTPVDGTAPLVLYGYGSYGISSDATFGQARLSLLDRGFIIAIAHIRGGEEMGRAWYEEEGKLMHKMNTFHDFIACAKHLVQKKYTARKRLFALGGSAGGMLMGAVMNMRPDLFKGIVAVVPFVDVLTTMLDSTIPLTTQEYDEWGNPNDESYYRYMHQYSPYDNVTDQKYPATLVSTGYHDSQVQYWEPAKWVAKLRDHQQGDAPILFDINLEAGHGGASGRYQQYKEVAMYYAFIVGVFEGKIGN